MNQPYPSVPNGPDGSHSFVSQLLFGLALIVAFAVLLWVLTDPVAALLTVTAIGAAGVLLVGTTDAVAGGDERND